MVCSNCGKENLEGSLFCSNCNNKFEDDTQGGWIPREEIIKRNLKSGMNPFKFMYPEELIKNEYLQEYEEKINHYNGEIINLNADLYVVNKILKFRFDIFGGKSYFFHQILNNFYNMSILKINKMICDQGSAQTIKILKNKITDLYLKNEYKVYFNKRLCRKLLKKIEDEAKNMKEIRDKSIAHIDKNYFNDIKIYYPGYKEIKDVCAKLNELMKILNLNTYYKSPLDEYKNGESDIEKILDFVVKESVTFKEFQEYPDRKRLYNDDEIRIINIYREKFNLEKL